MNLHKSIALLLVIVSAADVVRAGFRSSLVKGSLAIDSQTAREIKFKDCAKRAYFRLRHARFLRVTEKVSKKYMVLPIERAKDVEKSDGKRCYSIKADISSLKSGSYAMEPLNGSFSKIKYYESLPGDLVIPENSQAPANHDSPKEAKKAAKLAAENKRLTDELSKLQKELKAALAVTRPSAEQIAQVTELRQEIDNLKQQAQLHSQLQIEHAKLKQELDDIRQSKTMVDSLKEESQISPESDKDEAIAKYKQLLADEQKSAYEAVNRIAQLEAELQYVRERNSQATRSALTNELVGFGQGEAESTLDYSESENGDLGVSSVTSGDSNPNAADNVSGDDAQSQTSELKGGNMAQPDGSDDLLQAGLNLSQHSGESGEGESESPGGATGGSQAAATAKVAEQVEPSKNNPEPWDKWWYSF